jgi:hypothetical protein
VSQNAETQKDESRYDQKTQFVKVQLATWHGHHELYQSATVAKVRLHAFRKSGRSVNIDND